MGRKIWAFVAYNLYAVFLIFAFQENTAYLFDVSLTKQMELEGFSFDPNEGWGNHYIWRLFACIVVTAIVGFLAGSIAKSKGALTAAISNIPSVLIWTVLVYLFGSHNVQLEKKTAFLIVSIIAIPLSTYIAFIAGGFGENFQKENYEEDTILGVKPYHWIWAIFPIYWYAFNIIYVSAKFIAFQFATWGDIGIVISIVSLISLLPILAWGYPLLFIYRVLTGELLAEKNGFIRGMANFVILILGIGVATGLQIGSYWLLEKVVS